MNTKLLEAIYESALDGEITAEQCQTMEDILMQEKVFDNPIRKFMDKIKSIRDEKPDEFSGAPVVKNYIDKNYNELSKAADILENEPSTLRKDQIKVLIGTVSTIIGGILISSVSVLANVGFVVVITAYLGAIISAIVTYIRTNDDQAAYNNLIKIRESLKKVVKSTKLDNDTKKKISSMINKIDDVETEFNSGGLKMNKSSD